MSAGVAQNPLLWKSAALLLQELTNKPQSFQRRETLRYPSRPTTKHSGRLRRRERLGRLHIDYEKLEPYPLKFVETPTVAVERQQTSLAVAHHADRARRTAL